MGCVYALLLYLAVHSHSRRNIMLNKLLSAGIALGLVAAIPQTAYAQHHESGREHREEKRDEKRKNTIIGAGIGLLGAAIFSNGDPWATLSGAAVGGAIGNAITKDKRHDRRWRDRRRDDHRRDDRRRRD